MNRYRGGATLYPEALGSYRFAVQIYMQILCRFVAEPGAPGSFYQSAHAGFALAQQGAQRFGPFAMWKMRHNHQVQLAVIDGGLRAQLNSAACLPAVANREGTEGALPFKAFAAKDARACRQICVLASARLGDSAY